MTLDIIQQRMQDYSPHSKQEEENAFKEICQEIALAGLSRAGLFKKAAFQGGTCLRILHHLKRFSEDLDFVLMEKDSNFQWTPYFQSIVTEFQSFGLSVETIDRSEAKGSIRMAFLKEDSFGKVLQLNYRRNTSDQQKIIIKLEVDVNPPEGSTYTSHYLSYPYPFPVISQDLESLFASKCHALLARPYVKGRDWFDFIWYAQRKTKLNETLLKNALLQAGPFQHSLFSREWLKTELLNKVNSIDWEKARQDIERFISSDQKHHLISWNKDFFGSLVIQSSLA